MIDIFNELYTLVVNALTSYDENIATSSVYQNVPSKYPFVSFEEIENYPYENGMDDGDIENFVNVEYEINIYTQLPQKKSEGESIANVVDALMKSKGFVRRTKTPLQNSKETTYRIVMRYGGVVSKDNVVYRR